MVDERRPAHNHNTLRNFNFRPVRRWAGHSATSGLCATYLYSLGHNAQIVWIVVYRSVAAPVNAELARQARAHSVPTDARALQARSDSVIVARVLLMGFAVVALAGALVGSAQWRTP